MPVIIGVGQVTNKSSDPDDARDPLTLAEGAVRAAAADTGAADPEALLAAMDSIDVVNVVSWLYDDIAAQLASRVGASPARTVHGPPGGDQPTKTIDQAAARIARGDSRISVVAGAEAVRSLERALKAGSFPEWPPAPPGAQMVNPRDFVSDVAWEHGLAMPVDVYPLYENGARAADGLSLAAGDTASARLWAIASEVAATNPGAWSTRTYSSEELLAGGPDNRLIAHPYRKLSCALLSVDQSAAVILSDTETARRLGVAEERWVYPWAGAAAHDSQDVLARTSYSRSPAMEQVLDDALASAGVGFEDVDLLELYSCFPCVPKMARRHLGLASTDDRFTVTGTLTFFGGPANAYMLCAVAAMVPALRRGDGSTALLYGQGEFVTKHHALVVGRSPRPGGEAYPVDDEDGRQQRLDKAAADLAPTLALEPGGAGTVETFTVTYGRDGAPERGIVVGRLGNGDRFVANTPAGDAETFSLLTGGKVEPVGLTCTVGRGEGARNLVELHP